MDRAAAGVHYDRKQKKGYQYYWRPFLLCQAVSKSLERLIWPGLLCGPVPPGAIGSSLAAFL